MADNIENNYNQRPVRTGSSATGWILGAIIALAAIGALWYYGARNDTSTATNVTVEPPAATAPADTNTTQAPATTTAPTNETTATGSTTATEPATGTTAPATGTTGTETAPATGNQPATDSGTGSGSTTAPANP